MKSRNKWRISTAICFVLFVVSIVVLVISNKNKQGILPTDIVNERNNQTALFVEEDEILYVGTHDNTLHAYNMNGEELWAKEGTGVYSSLKYNPSTDLLYAGNEDGNIYLFNAKTGELRSTINIQRRIVSIDVNEDGSKIAVATATGSSKSNILLFTSEGEQLMNEQMKVKQGTIYFDADGESLIVSNSRGEVIRYDKEMKQQAIYKSNYTVLQMPKIGDHYWLISKNGSYACLDSELNFLRGGIVTNESMATISSIGIDSDENYVLVGTEEGYLYIMDSSDKQIFSQNFNVRIASFENVKESVYMFGYSGLINSIYPGNIQNMNFYATLADAMRIVVIVFGILLICGLIMCFEKSAVRATKLLKLMWKCKIAYIMLLPTFVLIFFFNYRGIFIAFIRAFTDWSIVHNTVAKMSFVGFDNFQRMFTEGYFLTGMNNLLILIGSSILKTLTVPIAVAYMCYSIKGDRRKYIHRFLFTLPIVVPGVIGAMVWKKFYDPNIGLFNELLGKLGLESLQRVWLGDAKTAIWSVVFMGFPFVGAMAFLVYYGGFINIGNEIVESAQIDGASRSRIFWRIQLPMIRGQISTMLTLTIIGSMQDFNGIYILTSGGPGTSTYVPALELYFNVSQFGNYGYACAMGVILFIFTMTVTIISRKITQERD